MRREDGGDFPATPEAPLKRLKTLENHGMPDVGKTYGKTYGKVYGTSATDGVWNPHLLEDHTPRAG